MAPSPSWTTTLSLTDDIPARLAEKAGDSIARLSMQAAAAAGQTAFDPPLPDGDARHFRSLASVPKVSQEDANMIEQVMPLVEKLGDNDRPSTGELRLLGTQILGARRRLLETWEAAADLFGLTGDQFAELYETVPMDVKNAGPEAVVAWTNEKLGTDVHLEDAVTAMAEATDGPRAAPVPQVAHGVGTLRAPVTVARARGKAQRRAAAKVAKASKRRNRR